MGFNGVRKFVYFGGVRGCGVVIVDDGRRRHLLEGIGSLLVCSWVEFKINRLVG